MEPPADSSFKVNNTEDTGIDDAEIICSPSGRESYFEPSLQHAVSLSSDHGVKPADGVSARSVRSA